MVYFNKIILFSLLGICVVFINTNSLSANFVENNGQFPENVRFLFQAKDANVWINNSEILFDFFHENKFSRSTLKFFQSQ